MNLLFQNQKSIIYTSEQDFVLVCVILPSFLAPPYILSAVPVDSSVCQGLSVAPF